MHWLKRLFGCSAKGVPVASELLDYTGRIGRAFGQHIGRLRAGAIDSAILPLLDDVQPRFSQNARAISDLARQCHIDGGFHTKSFPKERSGPAWLVATALPVRPNGAAEFFAQAYPSGYPQHIETLLASEGHRIAEACGHSVLAELLLYVGRSTNEGLSVGIALVRFDPERWKSAPLLILPEECLTSEDKSRLRGEELGEDHEESEGELAWRLVRLTKKADEEARANADGKFGFPVARAEIRTIGEQVFARAGKPGMIRLCHQVHTLGGNARLVEQAWDGIGDWRG